MAERTRNVERLAAALRPDVEEIASALQGCFNDAVEAGTRRAKEEIRAEFGPRFDRMDARLDRQDETLRMIRKQHGGNGKLPIDD